MMASCLGGAGAIDDVVSCQVALFTPGVAVQWGRTDRTKLQAYLEEEEGIITHPFSLKATDLMALPFPSLATLTLDGP